jgi:hypothetical protein
MNININNALQLLCENINKAYGNGCLNYGEAVESLLENQAGNYITTDGNQFCAVNDAYDIVLFITRESSSPNEQQAGGMKNTLYRTTNFKMAVNSKTLQDEYILTSIINGTTGIAYLSSNYDGKGVAVTMFGLEERNFQTAFFTIDFSAIEKITCQPC